MPKTVSSIRLTYTDGGSSDKEYNAAINEVSPGLYTVDCAWGRRGSPSQRGTKTPSPVPFASAEKIYDKVVAEKTGKGYIVAGTGGAGGPTGTAPASFAGAATKAKTSFLPQLLNEIDEAEMERLINNPDFGVQEKSDGERRAALKGGKEGANKKGQLVGLPQETSEAIIKSLEGEDATLDAELVGKEFIAFDILSYKGDDLRAAPYYERLSILKSAVRPNLLVTVVSTARSAADKRAKISALRSKNAEGVVFKDMNAPYTAGRPASGGAQFKFKFKASATVKVASITAGKRSVATSVLEADGSWRDVGKVTIPPNRDIPAVGALVEVEYLYAYPTSSLFQPVYKGERSDVDESDCKASQLKFKAGTT